MVADCKWSFCVKKVSNPSQTPSGESGMRVPLAEVALRGCCYAVEPGENVFVGFRRGLVVVEGGDGDERQPDVAAVEEGR